ncbi:MAG: glycoside hydrolase family 3 C-terminal domain-containing protein [Verrucomicrobiales bacterium]|nr:glycoside hydrolase family 3 C-terminal domain-containing protein [Verrucomicrobiales bacterium]
MNIAACGAAFVLSLTVSAARAEETPKYLDPKIGIEERLDDLLPRLTQEEKISQVSDDWGSKGIPRLKVPGLFKTEGLHSQSYGKFATVFPHAISRASSFDLELENAIGKQTALESRSAGIRMSWSPVLDVVRDSRWGRMEETYGESPYLVGRMGVAWIKGFQGEGTAVATPKHFAAHGLPVGGRDSMDYGLSERVMREVHLVPFREAFVEAKAGGVMAAYGLWEGVPDNASVTLLRKILRQEWGFDGILVSDCGGPEHFIEKHGIAATVAEAAALAMTAGVNMECGSIYNKKGGIAAAIEQGLATTEQLDGLVRDVLRVKMRLGLFDDPKVATRWLSEQVEGNNSSEARALALKSAVESAVLLKNDNHTLPFTNKIRAIAVIGPNAAFGQVGDYSPSWQQGRVVSVLDGIKARAGNSVQVLYAPGVAEAKHAANLPNEKPRPASPLDYWSDDTSKIAEAVETAKKADVAVIVVGDHSIHDGSLETTGENNDGATLEFTGVQRQLIREVAEKSGKPVVLIIVNGKPVTLAWEAENIPAILVTWYPGQEGGTAAAKLLFGDENPSGKLPVTWPRHVGQVPLWTEVHPSGRRYDYFDMRGTPQWKLGHGLSYTTFEYSNLRVSPSATPGNFTVSADIANTGGADGTEVAQLYLTDLISSVSTPIIRLVGFQRVPLKKGERKTVSFELTPYLRSLLDANMTRRVEPGDFVAHVGGGAPSSKNEYKLNWAKREEGSAHRKAETRFDDPSLGVSGTFNDPNAYAADFEYTVNAPASVSGGENFPVTVSVKNNGNLTDVTEVKLFGDFELDSWRFELQPGETKSHTFDLALYRSGNLSLVAGNKLIARPLTVSKSPARLKFTKERYPVNEDGVLKFSTDVRNAGSEAYNGKLVLKVDGQPADAGQPLTLAPGEQKKVSVSHTFAVSGLHKVQVNDLPEQQMIVKGGVALALKNPLIWLKFDGNLKNEITGEELNAKASPQWGAGKDGGKALTLDKGDAGIVAGAADLYRKSFTLSALVKINKLDPQKEEIGLFGGTAPMGADQDATGTVLQVGVREKKPFMGFFGRDIKGNKEVPVGEWVTLTFVYDAERQKGAFYINGNLDKEENQKNYTGPLDVIGDSPMLKHGNYLLGEVLVAQDALSAQGAKALAEKGVEGLRTGEYESDWRAADNDAKAVNVVAEIPKGSAIILSVETGENGKAANSADIKLADGAKSYPLTVRKGEQIRLKVKLENTGLGANPVLRSVTVSGVKWSSSADWNKGKTTGNVSTNAGE